MNRYGLLFLTLVFSLVSCGNDDDNKPENTQPNKLTKVTCVKNNAASPEFVLTVTYNQDKEIATIVQEGISTDVYTYATNHLTVNSFSSEGSTSPLLSKKMQYELSSGGIVKSQESLYNPYKNDEEYLANVYTFAYSRNDLTVSSWDQAVWPKTDGTGYESRTGLEAYSYTWENNSVSLCKSGTKEMALTYKNDKRPTSFPLRFVNTFNPVGVDAVSPFNFFFGNNNAYLPESASVYVLPDVNTLHAKYTFSYVAAGDYIRIMTIKEEIFPVDGATAATNIYTYSFEYNYQ